MTREEFLRNLGILGAGAIMAPSLLASCKKDDNLDVNFNGKVIIIGAGAAGLMAAYTLNKYNIDFEILEAGSDFGGRVKKHSSFAEFPIDLGAEWLHTSPKVFGEMIDDDSVDGSVELIPYSPQSIQIWKNNKLVNRNWVSYVYSEFKFKRTTWYDFFDQYIVPGISSRIRYNTPVTEIDASGSRVSITNTDGEVLEADKVIVTVPLSILKNRSINFIPAYSAAKFAALDDIDYPPGIKVFMKFSERFYPDLVMMDSLLGENAQEQLYYDAAFRKDSPDHVMALFYVGEGAAKFTDLESDEEIINAVLSELDEMFDGKATQTLERYVVQNWSAEPYIQGSYSHFGSGVSKTQETLAEPIAGRIHFAGEAFAESDTSTVHGAGLSGNEVAKTIMRGD